MKNYRKLFSTGAKPAINDKKANICFTIDLQLVSNHKSVMNTYWYRDKNYNTTPPPTARGGCSSCPPRIV
jgi:hypothetical protein